MRQYATTISPRGGWGTTTTGPSLRKFQFLQEIAAGGFGSVYLAKLVLPTGESRIVAVKMLHRRWADNVEIASRMRDEARLLARIQHENIIEVVDFVIIGGRPAVVMEVLEAVDLKVIIDHSAAAGKHVPVGVALRIASYVARALHAAYNLVSAPDQRPLRVIHRDIKPSNVMVDDKGHVKVLDFGVARAEFEAREAKTADLAFGSLEYMPPERLFFEPESAASDVYSLGTALFELLALEKLGKAKLRQSEQQRFLAERLADLVERRSVPPGDFEADLVSALQSMLAFDESKRPAAGQLADDLAALATRAADHGEVALGAWAQQAVPPLLEASRAQFQGNGTMMGAIITEDPPVDSAKPAPAGPQQPRVPPDPDEIDEEDAELLELDDDDSDAADGETATVIEPRAMSMNPEEYTQEDVETAFHTDLLAREDLVEGLLEAGQGDTNWTALRDETLASLSESKPFAVSADDRPSARPTERRNRPDPGGEAWIDEGLLEGTQTESQTELVAHMLSPPPNVDLAPVFDAETVVVPVGEAETLVAAAPAVAPPASGSASVPPASVSAPGPASGSAPGSAPGPTAALPAPNPSLPPYAARGYVDPRTNPTPPGSSSPWPPPARPKPPIPMGYVLGGLMLIVAAALLFLSGITVGGFGFAAITLPSRRAAPAPVAPPIHVAPRPVAPRPVVPRPIVPRPAAPAPIVPVPAPAPPVRAAAQGPSFRSLLPGTRRIVVRCDGATGTGTDEVQMPGGSFAECTVTAVDGDRKRRTAVVTSVQPRAYRCFAAPSESACE